MTLFTISMGSDALHKRTELHVLVPSRHEGALKTLWTLHGMTDDHHGWLRATTIEALAERYGVCVVMPNADLSFYVDMAYGADYFTFIADELPEFLKRYFPISSRKEDSYIAGNSMGGYGAFEIAMRRPEQYHAAISLSGPMRIDWIWRVLSDGALARLIASKDLSAISRGISDFSVHNSIPEPLVKSLMSFGDACTARTFQAMFGLDAALRGGELDLFALAARLAQGPQPLKLMAYCGTEDYHYASNVQFADFARDTALDYTLITGCGAHEWAYWNRQIEDFMEKLFAIR